MSLVNLAGMSYTYTNSVVGRGRRPETPPWICSLPLAVMRCLPMIALGARLSPCTGRLHSPHSRTAIQRAAWLAVPISTILLLLPLLKATHLCAHCPSKANKTGVNMLWMKICIIKTHMKVLFVLACFKIRGVAGVYCCEGDLRALPAF